MRTMWVGSLVLLAMLKVAEAQTTARPAAVTTKPGAGAGLQWPQARVRFSEEKPVLGLPLRSSRSMVRCASDNTAYFNLSGDSQSADAAGAPRLYGISTGGEVKSLLRKLPVDFNDIEVRDFFVGERTIVTLLRAAKSDSQGVRETAYFLSMLDPQGDFRDLVKVEGHFRPLKVGVFGDGEMLVLGWDEANLMPMLALLKEDGTIRRFMDTDDPRAKGVFNRAKALPTSLQEAAFVPFGRNVLLTFPGTAEGVVQLSPAGVVGTIPIAIPAGYVLHDVLNSNGRSPLVARVQAAKDGEARGRFDEAQDPQRRLMEFNSYNGWFMREFVFDKPKVSEVTCAGNNSMTAIFGDAMPEASTGNATSVAPENAMQLMVGSVRR